MRFGALLAAMCLAVPANAATYFAHLQGKLTAQEDLSFNDPNMSVGETIVMTAKFSDAYINEEFFPPENPGDPWTSAIVARPAYVPPFGPSFFRIDSANFMWTASSEILDGPMIFFEGNKITGFYGDFIPDGATPGLESLGFITHVYDATGIYDNNYKTPGYTLVWDYAGSTFTRLDGPAAIPEPGSWLTMIVGFGLVGASARRRAATVRA